MNAVDHNNVVIFDDRGIPSIMCRFVRPKDAEEVPAVFKIGDKVADAIYISKYPNTVIDGRAYSMPMADPTANITFDEAVQACRCKGLGWHLMTAVEYEYLLNQSREKGTMPHGNTDWGKDYYHKDEQGKVSNFGRTYTGTGPVTWNHDHTPYGVSDLNGNVWEWLTGLRIKDGVIEFIPDNKAASPYCDLSKDSTEWQQAETSKGPVRANVECGEITITDTVVADDYTPDYDGVRIDELEVELSEIPQLLKDLGIIPDKRAEEEGKTYVYFDATEGEYLPVRGSAFGNTSNSGPSALHLMHPRSNSSDSIGFRSAFYEVNGKLIRTLYRYIDNGIFLKLTNKDLPIKSKKKKHNKKVQVQKRATAGESIENRPKEIEKREIFGHWEMDTVKGKRGVTKSCMLVLTERKTRDEIVIKLKDQGAASVVDALDRLERKWGDMFYKVFRSITVDNGVEFSDYEGMERSALKEEKRTFVFYCHPYSSWERGTNENNNRLIRRHIPKGVDFEDTTDEEIKYIETWINNYPRGIFDFKTSAELFDEELQKLA